MYLFILVMICCGYYTFTYGISQWKNERNKLGGISTMAVAVLGTIVPIVVMMIKQR